MTSKLTARETEVFDLMLQGKSAKEIAQEMHLSYRTVETYSARLQVKLGVSSALQAVCKVFSERIAALTGSPA